MDPAGGLRDLLRPPPHRGPLIAAGAVPFAIGLTVEELRLQQGSSRGFHAAILLAAGALIYWLGAQAPTEDGCPPAYQSVLLVTGLAVLGGGLLTAARGLGAGFGFAITPGLLVPALVLAALALWPALERASAICLLIAAIAGGVALLSAWDWIFGADATADRWLLLASALALVLACLALREAAPRHAQQLVNAAGLATGGIGTGALDAGVPGFWQVVLLAAGLGLLAFAALERAPGPAYVGVANLGLFVVNASGGDTLYWWPLVLLAAGGAMLAAGLRPRRPLPPEPRPYRAGEAPLAARAEDEEMVFRVRDD
jgi:hypothetical protein